MNVRHLLPPLRLIYLTAHLYTSMFFFFQMHTSCLYNCFLKLEEIVHFLIVCSTYFLFIRNNAPCRFVFLRKRAPARTCQASAPSRCVTMFTSYNKEVDPCYQSHMAMARIESAGKTSCLQQYSSLLSLAPVPI